MLVLLFLSSAAAFGQKEVDRLNSAADLFDDLMKVPEQSIPQDLLDKAKCAILVPGVKKGAFIFGGQYGRGFALCRKDNGVGWTGPAAVRVEGGSFGLQIGGQESDVFMLVMNDLGMKRLLSSKFTLGGEASAAAGPVGRQTSANTDLFLSAAILCWSRARGAFAGVSLAGSTLREDLDVNKAIYGKPYSNSDILTGKVPTPKSAERLESLLNKYSSRK
jgi:SH3 domain-containing YSC84-like protein 1